VNNQEYLSYSYLSETSMAVHAGSVIRPVSEFIKKITIYELPRMYPGNQVIEVNKVKKQTM